MPPPHRCPYRFRTGRGPEIREYADVTTSPPAVTVGVDFGTLSGRAVVVAVADGTELGTAVTDYRHGVVITNSRATGRVPPDWALQIPGDWREVLTDAVPRALAAAGVRPRPGPRHRHRLHVLHGAADHRGRSAAVRAAASSPDRPHAYPKLWRHHAAQPEADLIVRPGRGVRADLAGGLRGQGLQRVAAPQGAPGAPRGPGGLRRRRPLDRGRRLDRVAADRRGEPHPEHRRVQGPVPAGQPPGRRPFSAPSTRTSPASPPRSTTRCPGPARRRAC